MIICYAGGTHFTLDDEFYSIGLSWTEAEFAIVLRNTAFIIIILIHASYECATRELGDVLAIRICDTKPKNISPKGHIYPTWKSRLMFLVTNSWTWYDAISLCA